MSHAFLCSFRGLHMFLVPWAILRSNPELQATSIRRENPQRDECPPASLLLFDGLCVDGSSDTTTKRVLHMCLCQLVSCCFRHRWPVCLRVEVMSAKCFLWVYKSFSIIMTRSTGPYMLHVNVFSTTMYSSRPTRRVATLLYRDYLGTCSMHVSHFILHYFSSAICTIKTS